MGKEQLDHYRLTQRTLTDENLQLHIPSNILHVNHEPKIVPFSNPALQEELISKYLGGIITHEISQKLSDLELQDDKLVVLMCRLFGPLKNIWQNVDISGCQDQGRRCYQNLVGRDQDVKYSIMYKTALLYLIIYQQCKG